MTQITATTQPAQLGPTGSASMTKDSAAESPGNAIAKLNSDFETFLQLLTTQIKNQDPSEPLNSTEFVSQLASFSAVEQQINTNTKLDELLALNTKTDAAELAQWIGTSVRSIAATRYDGAPVEAFFDVPQSADAVKLRVEDADGLLVNRYPLDKSETSFSWDGTNFDGREAGHGLYSFTLETYSDGTLTGSIPAETFSPVREARREDGAVVLVFEDGSRQKADDVTAIRGLN